MTAVEPVRSIVIADDEPLARERLRRLMQNHPAWQIVGEATTGPEAVALVENLRPDALLLDIRLPGLGGLEVVESLKGPNRPSIIFVTACDDRAVEAFGTGAIDYLVKPFEAVRLSEALQRATRQGTGRLRQLLHQACDAASGGPDRPLSLRVGHGHVLLSPDRIEYVLADRRGCRVFSDGQWWRVNDSLTLLASRLPGRQFVRTSRFAVINLDYIVSIQAKSHGDQVVELRNGVQITVSRTRRAELYSRLGR